MKQRPFATMILSWLLLGCTSYHPYNMTGGYHEAQIGPDMFQVTFRGNGYTHKARAQDMTMLRAADVAASHGYRYFAITTDLSFDTWDISLHPYTGVLVALHQKSG